MLSTYAIHTEVAAYPIRSYRGDTLILLVDDDPTVLAVLKAVLTREGYRVIAAASPASALELAAHNAFHMLITDFQMPDMDGFTLASLLATSRVALPVVLISGSEHWELPLAEIAERRWNFMSKPIDRERLLRIIDGECRVRAASSRG